MLKDEMRRRLTAAMKAGRVVEKEILRVAISEIQAEENRRGSDLGEEDAEKVIRKIIKSDRESLAASPNASHIAKLEEEISILESLLPKQLSQDEIRSALEAVLDQIQSAKSDGQATGAAMKHLKALGAQVDGKLVGEVVRGLRASGA